MSNNDLIVTKTLSTGESQCREAGYTAVLSSSRSEWKSCSVGAENRQREGRFRGGASVTSPPGGSRGAGAGASGRRPGPSLHGASCL